MSENIGRKTQPFPTLLLLMVALFENFSELFYTSRKFSTLDLQICG